MKIVHVCPTSFGVGGILGGGERYPLELARALARAGADCELITFGRAAAAWRDASGLRVRVLRARGYLGGHLAHPLAPALVPALRRADLVHVHHMHSAPGLIAALTARLRGQRTAVTDHGLTGNDWGGRVQALYDRFLLVSAYSARMVRAPAARTALLYGGADAARYAPHADAAGADRAEGGGLVPSGTSPGTHSAARTDEPRDGVLFVGRLTPHKGVDRLLRALPPGARLTIAGSEGHDPRLPERDYPRLLRRLAEGRDVRFVVPAPDAELPALYRRARVFVLPSVHRTVYGRAIRISELLGLSLLEAMASGTPVIASALGGIPEIVEDGVTGYLVPPGDVDALRDRLAYLLDHPDAAAALGAAARARVLERYTWDACAARCLAAYAVLRQPTQRQRAAAPLERQRA